ncbi:hypothetical protein B0A48_14678 [Cryoendolithus antarcticus]|uniref:ASST-domain-containing protein n=1 Tax=Cryoendolithus antarcticus TaxID=1507870 RepID=A0A1V8SK56_9PEZI|nr:hypothetical protein B0A48_14678 [Cryoendolithus antarcticus]
MRSLLWYAALAALLVLPSTPFLTRPLSFAPTINVTINKNPSSGYVFIAPTGTDGNGPYIYDKAGNLVWDGAGVVGGADAYNFHVCLYNGSPHLCITGGLGHQGYAIGTAMILDANYRIVTSVQTGGPGNYADQHEFQVLAGGNAAVLSSYRSIAYDMTGMPHGVTMQQGFLMDSMFQEIDIKTGQVLFEWYASDHVPVNHTRVYPRSFGQVGDGYSGHSPFDYFHINSIDKSIKSNMYLISARHTNAVYAINSTSHEIVWRLVCPGTMPTSPSDFACQGFNFSSQHDARWVREDTDTTTISLFDNANNGVNQTDLISTGMIIDLNHKTGKAVLRLRSLPTASNVGQSVSQGNFQALPNGNYFFGYGSSQAFGEQFINSKGYFEVNYAATWTTGADSVGKTMCYRTFSYDWTSTPANTVPAVYVYAQEVGSANTIHVSWNGATTVAQWTFYAADDKFGNYTKVGTTKKNGFETMWTAPRYSRWWRVDALDQSGVPLRSSANSDTYVPSPALGGACDSTGCPIGPAWTAPTSSSTLSTPPATTAAATPKPT